MKQIIKKSLKKIFPLSVQYARFGYNPGKGIKKDLPAAFLGEKNLLKRLQAKDLMQAMAIAPTDQVLDIGCGSGMFTVEMAKQAQHATGMDLQREVLQIPVHPSLKEKLSFVQADATNTPFADNTFDVVLISELLGFFHDPTPVFTEIKRILKPGARLVLANGAGHPSIEKALEKNTLAARLLRRCFPKHFCSSYQEYAEILQKSFGNVTKGFHSAEQVQSWLQKCQYTDITIQFSPGRIAGNYLSWSQFLSFLRKGEPLSQHLFALKYPLLSFCSKMDSRCYQGGVVCVAKNQKS